MNNTDSKCNKKSFWARLVDVLASPYTRTPGLFALLYVAASLLFTYTFALCVYPGEDAGGNFYTAATLLADLFWTWAALLIYILLRPKWRRVAAFWLGLWCFVLLLNWLWDLGILQVYKAPFCSELCCVLLATNAGESIEFVSSYLKPNVFGYVILTIAALPMAYDLGKQLARFVAHKCRRLKPWLKIAVKCIFPVASIAGFVLSLAPLSKSAYITTPVGKIQTLLSQDTGHDLVHRNPKVTPFREDRPLKIVIIVGESHARNHSQLYGYNRATEPRLSRLKADSLLLTVPNANSMAVHTQESFHRFIGTFLCADSDPTEQWYENVTFLEVARKAGYRTSWISNQSPRGALNNHLTRIAKMADRMKFTTDGSHGSWYVCFDGDLLPYVDAWHDSVPELTVVHLMGSHYRYNDRTPAEWKHFKESDYREFPASQRAERASYDNSVLYTDYVVSEIMRRYAGDDAVVIYFSDHGEDVYVTDPEYTGHAIMSSDRSKDLCMHVPMYFYLTPRFRQLHPWHVARIEGVCKSQEYYLSNLIYLISDLMSVKFEVTPLKR